MCKPYLTAPPLGDLRSNSVVRAQSPSPSTRTPLKHLKHLKTPKTPETPKHLNTQTNANVVEATDFGQSRFGQSQFWQIQFWPIQFCCQYFWCHGGAPNWGPNPENWGPEGWGPDGWGPEGREPQNFALFLLLTLPFSFFFSLSGDLLTVSILSPSLGFFSWNFGGV